AVLKIVDQPHSWQNQREATKLVSDRLQAVSGSLQKELGAFFEEEGEFQFKIRLFGGRLPRLVHRQREGLPASLSGRLKERVVSIARGLGGMVGFSGGGGTRMVARLVRRTGFHHFLPS